MSQFEVLYKKYMLSDDPYLDWDKIEHIDDSIFSEHDNLEVPDQNRVNEINKKFAIVKLNGGLGTTMGCVGPKSLLEIKEGLTFMDIILEQCSKSPELPLVLMNSFYTDDQTKEFIFKTDRNLNIMTFSQNRYPRILKESKLPIESSDNKDHFYPPGHGDLLQSLKDTNTLDKLKQIGVEYIFISNVDNLGATIDYKIASNLLDSDTDFALELTPKTVSDVKGGTLIKYENKYRMFEIAQCHPEKLGEFTSVEKFKYFNTNNIWIKLSSIEQLLSQNYLKDIDIIINQKKLKDGRDCIQLEYAIGSMVKFFDKIKCFKVSRERFIPVKTNSDLLLIRSNKYEIDKENWSLNKV